MELEFTSLYSVSVVFSYDTIRYDIFACAQNLTKGQLSLAHGIETKK